MRDPQGTEAPTMSSDFDPYYKWLGIPPKNQPPHHYRLLGIECFEPDLEVIDAAANRVMSYLQNMSVGDQAEASQQLLNEIAAARLCLLDSERKASYDESLRGKSSSPKRKPPVRREQLPDSVAPATPSLAVSVTTTESPTPPRRKAKPQTQASPSSATDQSSKFDARRSRKQNNNQAMIAVLCVVFVAVLATGYYLLTREERSGKDGPKARAAYDKKDSRSDRDKSRKRKKSDEPSGLAGVGLTDRPRDPPEESDPDLPPQTREQFAQWMANANRAIRENRPGEAREILNRYLRYGDAPDQALAKNLREQCYFALISDVEAEHFLAQLEAPQLLLLRRGELRIRIDGVEFTRRNLEDSFYDRLRRRLEEIARDR